jgi:hypothetical protein
MVSLVPPAALVPTVILTLPLRRGSH